MLLIKNLPFTNVVANGHTYVAYNHNTSAQQLLIDNHLLVSAT